MVRGKQNTNDVALYMHTTYDSNSFRHIFHIMSYDTCVAGVFSLLEVVFTWDTIESFVKISQHTFEYTEFLKSRIPKPLLIIISNYTTQL